MPNFHHVNLYVTPENLEAQASFLTEVLGYKRMVVDDRMRGLGANWFQASDGTEVHLSTTPHAAIEYGAELAEVEKRLEQAGIEYKAVEGFKAPDGSDLRIVICKDPGDNQWELRGVPPMPSAG
jgi:hypothetical protein